jgi:ERCC4-type nuclease
MLPEESSSVRTRLNAFARVRAHGDIERMMTASEEELREVALVSPKIAERIRELVSGEYKG